MVHVMIPFEVKADSLSTVKRLISDFIAAIKENEQETLMYKSFQETDEPTKFIHVMTFTDEKAQEHHRNTDHCQEFVQELYPLCTVSPKATLYNEIS